MKRFYLSALVPFYGTNFKVTHVRRIVRFAETLKEIMMCKSGNNFYRKDEKIIKCYEII
jgi:hypothetical protein